MPTIQLNTAIPGPNSIALAQRRDAATARGAAKASQIAVVRASGAVVTDADGNTLLDFAGGIGALAAGHCPPAVVDAIKLQVEDLIHFCAIVGTYEPFVRVAELLNEVTPGDFPKKTVLLNSGAEANETAVKIARSATGRAAIVVFEGGYHGRTNLTLAMTSKYGLFKKGFGPFAPEIYRLPFPNLYRRPAGMDVEDYIDDCIARLDHAMIAQVDPSAIAAFVIEPVQGEGGFIPVPQRFLERIRQICDQHGIVMIADEVQCGFGRTGKLFAVEHYGITPDLIVTAKSIASGMPIAAVTGKAVIMDAPHPGGLGGTYSGNPLACVAAIETITLLRQPEFLARVEAVGARLRGHLDRLNAESTLVDDVRGLGAMLLIELVRNPLTRQPAPDETLAVIQEALKRGVIGMRAGIYSNCIRFLPPLVITDEQIDEGMAVFSDAVRAVEDRIGVRAL
ncbi:MAG: aspartate aminotransferase family protein [Anaerolineae bacterium]|nr:aspartate aminotransferase family protein [Anaerolineae bacterium]